MTGNLRGCFDRAKLVVISGHGLVRFIWELSCRANQIGGSPKYITCCDLLSKFRRQNRGNIDRIFPKDNFKGV
jgi:hypothetical protein